MGVLEGPQTDEKTGLVRVRGKSMVDASEGWITVKGNQGTPFLDECKKIFYCCRKADVPLQKDFETGSSTIRTLKEEEVMELVEGPRKEVLPDAQRGKLKATKDGAIGWITLKDRHEVVYADANPKLYTCTALVAMTDGEDIKSCKVLRKLAVGEFFEASGPVVEDPSTGVSRFAWQGVTGWQGGLDHLEGKCGHGLRGGSDQVLLGEERDPARKKNPVCRCREHSKNGSWRDLPVD